MSWIERAPADDGTGRTSLVGPVLGCLLLGGVALLVLIPRLVEPRHAGGPMSDLKTINTAQTLFREGDKDRDGKLDFASLQELSSASLIDPILGSGTKQGFRFDCRPSPGSPEFLWMAVAVPVSPEWGELSFAINQAGAVHCQDRPIEWNPRCELPPGAWEVGKRPPR